MENKNITNDDLINNLEERIEKLEFQVQELREALAVR